MGSFIICPVESSKDWRSFARFKDQLYLSLLNINEQSWEDVNRLFSFEKKNPNNKMAAFLAEKNGEILGRIVALADEKHAFQEEGFFGFFESIDDPDVTKALLQAAGEKLYQWGKKTMLGPISPSTNDKVGIITQGFDALPHPNLNYNPPYYQQLLEEAGLTKSMGLLSYLWTDDTLLPKHFTDLATLVMGSGESSLYYPARYSPRKEAPNLQEVYNESLCQNWGFVPLTRQEAENILHGFKISPEPDFLFYLTIDGEIAGLAIIQTNDRRILKKEDPQVRIAVLGLKPRFRKKGLSTILIFKIVEFLESRGYPSAELSLIMENNLTVRGMLEKTFGFPILHRYQVYQCQLPF